MVGVAYNVFDGEELLEYSINSIRELVDYVVVVAQEKSNYGQINPNLRKKLDELKVKGLIDVVHWYQPNIQFDEQGNVKRENGLNNEQRKRQIGLDLCLTYGCSIFSSMDCDELYDADDYSYALKDFNSGDYDSSFCQMITYYKKPNWELFPPETYYVPLFYKINCNTKFTFEFVPPYPVNIDPSRRIKAGYSRIYSRDEIQMHHFSYVREDIESKIRNSSARFSREEQDVVINHFHNATKIQQGALFLNNQRFDLIEVENKFNIEI
jgi:hypothetical protein